MWNFDAGGCAQVWRFGLPLSEPKLLAFVNSRKVIWCILMLFAWLQLTCLTKFKGWICTRAELDRRAVASLCCTLYIVSRICPWPWVKLLGPDQGPRPQMIQTRVLVIQTVRNADRILTHSRLIGRQRWFPLSPWAWILPGGSTNQTILSHLFKIWVEQLRLCMGGMAATCTHVATACDCRRSWEAVAPLPETALYELWLQVDPKVSRDGATPTLSMAYNEAKHIKIDVMDIICWVFGLPDDVQRNIWCSFEVLANGNEMTELLLYCLKTLLLYCLKTSTWKA